MPTDNPTGWLSREERDQRWRNCLPLCMEIVLELAAHAEAADAITAELRAKLAERDDALARAYRERDATVAEQQGEIERLRDALEFVQDRKNSLASVRDKARAALQPEAGA